MVGTNALNGPRPQQGGATTISAVRATLTIMVYLRDITTAWRATAAVSPHKGMGASLDAGLLLAKMRFISE
jgi:hypothetical protein